MKNIKIRCVLWIGLSLCIFASISISMSASLAESEVKPSILHPKGLLWKIEKSESPTSYLFGTMHVSDPLVTELSAPVEQAFVQADHFVMEVLMDFDALRYVSRLSFFSDGRTLQGVMGKSSYQRLRHLLNKRVLISENKMNKMKPWAVLMLLMLPADQPFASAPALDMVLYQRAEQRKVKVSGLETAQEQIAIFDTLSMSDQLWMLNRAVDEIDTTDALFAQLIKAYVDRDLAQLLSIQNKMNDANSDIDDRFMYQLLDMRNKRMAKRMLPILKQGKAFIAIGALHLPAKGGVLNLLEKQGYKVTPVY